MNSFEEKFFGKYIPEEQILLFIVHQHWIKIVDNLFLTFGLAVFIPSFIFFYSQRIAELIPFYFFEIYLILIFFKIIYDIFNWYNDVWIITDKCVVSLDWAILKANINTVSFENIEGVEVGQNGIWDKILRKGDLVIHKLGEDVFVLENAIKPHKVLDKIETLKNENTVKEEETDDKFDLVMDALSGVVKEYLGRYGISKKYSDKEKEDMKNEILEKVKSKKGTVDLR